MLVPPDGVTEDEVLAAVRQSWDHRVDAIEHQPVGFGAHHWLASVAEVRTYFVTLDEVGGADTEPCFERAYAAGSALAESGLEFLHAGLRAAGGSFTVPLGPGLLSVTPWLEAAGNREEGGEAGLLGRLHRAAAPRDLPRWRPLIDADLPARLAHQVATPWDTGPFGEVARLAITAKMTDLSNWVVDYLSACATSDPQSWVVTHGEPGSQNQLLTPAGWLVLVDLESLRLAPRERDLAALLPLHPEWLAAYGVADPQPTLLRAFDLEWRLAEIEDYARWFGAPHRGSPDDRIAIEGLRSELTRPDRPHFA